jgi:hypothetical protein
MPQESSNISALERLVREGTDADLRRFLLLLQGLFNLLKTEVLVLGF